jgi:hypothetical protein
MAKENIQWTDYIYPILLTYNNKMKHSAIGMTPNEARKPENELEAYVNMKMKAKHSRLYPNIAVDDKVKIYRKRLANEKGHVSLWSDEKYDVEAITNSHGMKFYKTSFRDRPYLRHEILKVI